MKSETEIRERYAQIVEGMKVKKHDMETTAIYGELKKDNPAFRGEWMTGARESLLELYLLSWILDEKITEDVFELARIS